MIINHGGISGGKDSTALALWMVKESGYPLNSILLSFCDTGNEAPETYEHVQRISETIHPVTTIKPPLDFWELAKAKGRFPAAKSRFCTEELKMKPTRAFIHALLRTYDCEILLHSGVRASESDDRALLPERELSVFFGTEVYRPLLGWSLDDVWAIHDRHGMSPNPLYGMGCERVGCFPCIMSKKKEVANIAKRRPERIAFIREKELTIDNRCGYSSMFARDKVPSRYRTMEITTAAKKVKPLPEHPDQITLDINVQARQTIPPQTMMVATIDDVVKWALNSPDLWSTEFDFFEGVPACDSRYGACE